MIIVIDYICLRGCAFGNGGGNSAFRVGDEFSEQHESLIEDDLHGRERICIQLFVLCSLQDGLDMQGM